MIILMKLKQSSLIREERFQKSKKKKLGCRESNPKLSGEEGSIVSRARKMRTEAEVFKPIRNNAKPT
jgi:hypothetical protein